MASLQNFEERIVDFTVGQYIQLIVALSLGSILFLIVNSIPEKITVAILLLFIPFQLIESKYGSSNMVFTYLVGGVLLLKGNLKLLPFFGAVILLFITYFVSFSQVPTSEWSINLFYMVTFASNFILFYVVYNFVYRTENYLFFFKILIILNIFVAIYCALQFIGLNDYLNIENSDIGIAANRDDSRLVGPFGATGLTAEYLIFQTLILCYLLFFYEKKRQLLYLALICTNLIFLLATGNRGGLLVLCLAFMGFSFFYRKELGVKNVFLLAIAGSFALVIASAITLYLSDLNVIYDRLLGTNTEGVVLDSRQKVWPAAWEAIIESPYVGHGPRLHRPDGSEYQAIAYPHSLYLFILYTVGIIGLAGHMVFFVCVITKIAKGTSGRISDEVLDGLPKLGLLIVGLFLISQIRIELFRFMTGDYQHYFFALLGFFVAVSDLRREQSGYSQVEEKELDVAMATGLDGGAVASPGFATGVFFGSKLGSAYQPGVITARKTSSVPRSNADLKAGSGVTLENRNDSTKDFDKEETKKEHLRATEFDWPMGINNAAASTSLASEIPDSAHVEANEEDMLEADNSPEEVAHRNAGETDELLGREVHGLTTNELELPFGVEGEESEQETVSQENRGERETPTKTLSPPEHADNVADKSPTIQHNLEQEALTPVNAPVEDAPVDSEPPVVLEKQPPLEDEVDWRSQESLQDTDLSPTLPERPAQQPDFLVETKVAAHFREQQTHFSTLLKGVRRYLRPYQWGVATLGKREQLLLKSANVDFILEVRAQVPAETLKDLFQSQTTIAPVETVAQLINQKQSGIGLNPLPAAPKEVTKKNQAVYFRLDNNCPAWQQLLTSKGMAFHVAEEVPELKMQLWVITP